MTDSTPEISESYQDFSIIFTNQMIEHIADRNANKIYEALDSAELEEGLSDADLCLLGMWRSLYKNDTESFWWLGYTLSIKEGYERLLAYLFIAAQQQGIPQ